MFNWFDVMQQAQSNAGLDVLTRQFKLSDDQAQKAMLAFLPAFVMGLQHMTLTAPSNPFLQNFPGNPWQIPGQVLSAQAQQNGKRLIDSLFGSDDASRRIAHRAADFTGLNVDLMQQMLPVMAGIFAGTLHQMATGQGRLADILADQPKEPEKKQAPTDPWTAAWVGWMQAFQSGPEESRSVREPSKPSRESAESGEAPLSWQSMMQKGHEMQMQYLTSLQSILDEAWKPRKL
ncbi:DUF937 domain-containing protein [Microvirga rosea]|uniref:DUF937 domain-containing protein n=1 Tax=Microvirga rosea TaxID=2715425 RepID=UPI001D0A24AD|nr:DUF937 domain-containing protein [Microvirga rosea]MCB8820361.1 DUF937 domain-containing protein [Microvirga rosea]